MKTVYIQYQDGIPITVNTYIAEYGFRRKGYQIERFTLQDVELWEREKKLDDNYMLYARNFIYVGGTFTLLRIMDLLNIKRPRTYNPQDVLPDYCGRWIHEKTLGFARKSWQKEQKFFIKPAEDTKIFTGFVPKSDIDFIKLSGLSDDLPILMSEVVNIKSEYRCFVNRKKLIGIQHYNGDFKIRINSSIVENAINDFKNQPAGYTLDFGITDTGKQILIEVNDGYALGYCGIHPYIYCQLLEDRWEEIIRNNTINCH